MSATDEKTHDPGANFRQSALGLTYDSFESKLLQLFSIDLIIGGHSHYKRTPNA